MFFFQLCEFAASMLAKRKRTPVLCAEHLTCVQVHECRYHPHPGPAFAEHLTCVQVHECHLTCVQVHECHHPHPTPPAVPLFSCKIHRDHGTVPASNISPVPIGNRGELLVSWRVPHVTTLLPAPAPRDEGPERQVVTDFLHGCSMCPSLTYKSTTISHNLIEIY